jgi:hypothetical protein
VEPFLFVRDNGLVIHGPDAPYQQITTVEEWRIHGKPFAGDAHWEDSYSAKEVAKAWLRDGEPRLPAEFGSLFASHELTRMLEVATAVPELVTPLRVTRGGGRHHDLVLFGEAQTQRVVVGVEAKTDEPLDDLLWVRIARVWEREIRGGKATAQIERLQRLCEAIFGRPLLSLDHAGTVVADAKLATLPYQLFSGVVGTLVEARRRGAGLAVFVVYSFSCKSFEAKAVADNEAGLRSFLRPLVSVRAPLESGALFGPLQVPGSQYVPPLPLLAGSVTTAIPPNPAHRRVMPSPTTLERLRGSYEAALGSPVLAEAVHTREAIPARRGTAAGAEPAP